ncbi:uncharacterized protein PHALS_15135 [Plasmopara halstedii]|uniref:Uncharacterized protein n=1 Tax=Plasmopara halstedii TaxID=4781 RepID=A0A0P1A5S0_PLAHL|nr:uncharacterized protein PHALS_15135 [Plasmopara halstedii]CEG35730.1 hypothetical protein PHALS_15135 [Plasmopara halstedii]|eukprot:XP_024572099.1 hypothetical protein PHALS_15135 [Plasmopara halstedii]
MADNIICVVSWTVWITRKPTKEPKQKGDKRKTPTTHKIDSQSHTYLPLHYVSILAYWNHARMCHYP